MNEDRREFLLRMYDQMFNDINRHILVVWQSIGVIVGAFAIFALVEKGIVSHDVACGIVLLLCTWSIAHIYDASYWYNRNLVIIANIERQFLKIKDTKEICWYFATHRKHNKMISHLEIQYFLSVGLAIIVVIYHFSVRVYPGIVAAQSKFDPERAIPYLVLLIAIFFLYKVAKGKNARYAEFLEKSPGKELKTEDFSDTIGHAQR